MVKSLRISQRKKEELRRRNQIGMEKWLSDVIYLQLVEGELTGRDLPSHVDTEVLAQSIENRGCEACNAL
jgi:hypothetical protein